MTVEKWQLAVAALGLLGTFSAFVGSVLWWVTRRVASFVENEKQLIRATRAQADAIGTISARVDKLSEAASLLSQKMQIRDHEQARFEGQVQAINGSLVTVIGGLQQATGSLDAVWRTLQLLHPDRVPKRARDRG